MPDRTIEALLLEDRTFVPPPAFGQTATMRDERVYDEAAKDLEGFWARAAGDLHWFAKWRTVLEGAPPYAKRFVGGRTYMTDKVLDRPAKARPRTKTPITSGRPPAADGGAATSCRASGTPTKRGPGPRRSSTWWWCAVSVRPRLSIFRKAGTTGGTG